MTLESVYQPNVYDAVDSFPADSVIVVKAVYRDNMVKLLKAFPIKIEGVLNNRVIAIITPQAFLKSILEFIDRAIPNTNYQIAKNLTIDNIFTNRDILYNIRNNLDIANIYLD